MRSITAEIILILTNVTWTNVTWTNVTVTVGICSRSSQKPFKFNQNQINNSGDILDIDKCHLFKCCLVKCHRDSWNLSYIFSGTCL